MLARELKKREIGESYNRLRERGGQHVNGLTEFGAWALLGQKNYFKILAWGGQGLLIIQRKSATVREERLKPNDLEAVRVRDRYSNLVELRATTPCFFEDQAIRLLPRNTSTPVVDLLSSILLAQSASANAVKAIDFAAEKRRP